MIHIGAGATMIVITTLIMDTTTTILIMGITTIIHIMDITTIIILLIDMIGKIITITTKILMEIPLVSILQLMVEEGIAAVMIIIVTKTMAPIVLIGIIITTLTIALLALIMKEIHVVMTIPQEVVITITIIPMIIPPVPTMKVVATMVEGMMVDIKELKEIIK